MTSLTELKKLLTKYEKENKQFTMSKTASVVTGKKRRIANPHYKNRTKEIASVKRQIKGLQDSSARKRSRSSSPKRSPKKEKIFSEKEKEQLISKLKAVRVTEDQKREIISALKKGYKPKSGSPGKSWSSSYSSARQSLGSSSLSW